MSKRQKGHSKQSCKLVDLKRVVSTALEILASPRAWRFLFILTLIVLPELAWAKKVAIVEAGDPLFAVETSANTLMAKIFGPAFKLVILILGAAKGSIEAISSSSLKPFIGFFGGGVALSFIPNIVKWLSTLGSSAA